MFSSTSPRSKQLIPNKQYSRNSSRSHNPGDHGNVVALYTYANAIFDIYHVKLCVRLVNYITRFDSIIASSSEAALPFAPRTPTLGGRRRRRRRRHGRRCGQEDRPVEILVKPGRSRNDRNNIPG